MQKFLHQMNLEDVHNFSSVNAFLKHGLATLEQAKLIIMDADATVYNCEVICQDVEKLQHWTDIPIVLATAHETPEVINRVLECGIFDFILKPLEFMHFKTRILVAYKYAEESIKRKNREMQLLNDLLFAKHVQKKALPERLKRKYVECDGRYFASNSLGGDMYYWFQINQHQTAVLIYDVMGHGIATSLVTMSIRSLLKGIITRLVEPTLVMKELNRQIYSLFSNDDLDSFLVTAFYMVIDTNKQTIDYINAAHPSAILMHQNGETLSLSSNSPILGLFAQIEFEQQTITVPNWCRIILYTDGLLQQQVNEQLIIQFFHSYASQHNRYTLEKFVEKYNLREDYYKDDISVVSVTISLEGR